MSVDLFIVLLKLHVKFNLDQRYFYIAFGGNILCLPAPLTYIQLVSN
jgi:hypothetical protein